MCVRFIVFAFALICESAAADTGELTLLYTTDIHARLLPDKDGRGGWSNIAGYFRQARLEAKSSGRPVLILDGGDMIQGTVVSSIFRGEPIFEVMNAAGYDCAVLGNHEFDLGSEQLRRFLEIAEFPLLAANIERGGRLVADAPALVFLLNGIRVGVIGIGTSEWVYDEALTFIDPAVAVRDQIRRLETEADLMVVLSHLGIEKDRRLAREAVGIDIILGGHSHLLTAEVERVGKTVVVQAGAFGHFVGRMDVDMGDDGSRVEEIRWKLVPMPLDGIQADPATHKVVAYWEGLVAEEVNMVIGDNAGLLSRDGVLRTRIGEIWRDAFDVDFGYQNPGANMQDLAAGPIRVRDFYEILPWGNTLATVRLSPDQVRQLLDEVPFTDGRGFHTAVTNSFEARNWRERFNLTEADVKAIPILARDPIIEYVRKYGRLTK